MNVLFYLLFAFVLFCNLCNVIYNHVGCTIFTIYIFPFNFLRDDGGYCTQLIIFYSLLTIVFHSVE